MNIINNNNSNNNNNANDDFFSFKHFNHNSLGWLSLMEKGTWDVLELIIKDKLLMKFKFISPYLYQGSLDFHARCFYHWDTRTKIL